jgi:hypothetical protein
MNGEMLSAPAGPSFETRRLQRRSLYLATIALSV